MENNINPFKITTPEDLSAEETVKLFVDVFTDFYHITDPGNVILKGPRGVGKSMMLRYLEPDCQCIVRTCTINKLPYIAIYVPLKNTNFALAELKNFENKHAYVLLNEHIMVSHCLIRVFDNLINSNVFYDADVNKIKKFYEEDFTSILEIEPEIINQDANVLDLLSIMLKQLENVYRDVMKYIKMCSFKNGISPYDGSLYDYNDYFIPVVERLANAISDSGTTFYIMLDDAHYLSDVQTQILNSWIASRTSRKVSLKVSTQYNYKTYYTTNGATIDTPHDYIDLDMATVYTEGNRTAKSTYYRRIYDIVEKRLKLFGIDTNVYDFFPPDLKQEERISEIAKQYNLAYDDGKGRGHNRTDDATRYSRPDYIKELAGKSKSTYTYSYAGFDQLVNISSGVVRYFLQQAHSMYAKQVALLDNEMEKVVFISPNVQNTVIRERANQVLFSDLEAYSKEGHDRAYPKEEIFKLSNLIQGLGGLFRTILLSGRSERRIFSIAISDEPSEEVLRILDIGIQLGYFHKSTIGRKDSGSIGRTKLYVLNRMLAPIWTLDPNGFAGYLFIKNSILEKAIEDPFKMIKESELYKNKKDEIQITLFDLFPELNREGEVEIIDGESEN